MPEGHSVQRTANEFNKKFKGKVVRVDSPQGRFSSEAKLIDGQVLKSAKAIGKQLFLNFDNGLTCRVHLGIYGKWRFIDEIEKVMYGQVRARFYNEEFLADLRGPTICEVIDKRAVKDIENRLGPDPTNTDPRGLHKQGFIERVQNSASPIGILLMNQEVISGIGNVYRAEILFRAQISPHVPGKALSVSQIEELWLDSVKLMKVGVATGFMTTREERLKKRTKKADRNYVYKREGQKCLRCEGLVAIELMATRKLYWCPGCQF
jgi:endonuclease VIII